jgi:flagellar biosynthesis anti-sigma factor FlgM
MQIYGPSHLHQAHAISRPQTAPATQPAAPSAPASTSDVLEISDIGNFVDQVHDLPEIRHNRVQEIRDALANGTYDIDGKLELALGALLDEIG